MILRPFKILTFVKKKVSYPLFYKRCNFLSFASISFTSFKKTQIYHLVILLLVIRPVIWCFPIWLTSSVSYPMAIFSANEIRTIGHFSVEINFPFHTSCLVLPWCQLCFQLKFQYLCVLNRTPLKSKMSKTKNSSYHQVHPNITHFRNTSKFAIFLEFENHWFLFPRVNLTKFKHRNTAAQKRKR